MLSLLLITAPKVPVKLERAKNERVTVLALAVPNPKSAVLKPSIL